MGPNSHLYPPQLKQQEKQEGSSMLRHNMGVTGNTGARVSLLVPNFLTVQVYLPVTASAVPQYIEEIDVGSF